MQVAGTTLQEREEGQYYDYTGFSMFPLKRKKKTKKGDESAIAQTQSKGAFVITFVDC